MIQLNLWEEFERTGRVNDYLNFLACTIEEPQIPGRKEGGYSGRTTDNDRDDTNSHAYR